jgi:hypothetical protein
MRVPSFTQNVQNLLKKQFCLNNAQVELFSFFVFGQSPLVVTVLFNISPIQTLSKVESNLPI